LGLLALRKRSVGNKLAGTGIEVLQAGDVLVIARVAGDEDESIRKGGRGANQVVGTVLDWRLRLAQGAAKRGGAENDPLIDRENGDATQKLAQLPACLNRVTVAKHAVVQLDQAEARQGKPIGEQSGHEHVGGTDVTEVVNDKICIGEVFHSERSRLSSHCAAARSCLS
jgi:hypothetical protein